MNIKCSLFKSYCYPIYTCHYCLYIGWHRWINWELVITTLWDRRHSTRTLFDQNRVTRSFHEIVDAIVSYNLICRVLLCDNDIMQTVLHSDCYTLSSQRLKWSQRFGLRGLRDLVSEVSEIWSHIFLLCGFFFCWNKDYL